MPILNSEGQVVSDSSWIPDFQRRCKRLICDVFSLPEHAISSVHILWDRQFLAAGFHFSFVIYVSSTFSQVFRDAGVSVEETGRFVIAVSIDDAMVRNYEALVYARVNTDGEVPPEVGFAYERFRDYIYQLYANFRLAESGEPHAVVFYAPQVDASPTTAQRFEKGTKKGIMGRERVRVVRFV